jgi:hypothetical protein
MLFVSHQNSTSTKSNVRLACLPASCLKFMSCTGLQWIITKQQRISEKGIHQKNLCYPAAVFLHNLAGDTLRVQCVGIVNKHVWI